MKTPPAVQRAGVVAFQSSLSYEHHSRHVERSIPRCYRYPLQSGGGFIRLMPLIVLFARSRGAVRGRHLSSPFPNMFMKPSGMVIVGVIGMMLFGWLTYSDISTPPPRPLLESEVSYFRGRAAKIQMVVKRYGFANFRVWLVDHPVAFQQMMQAGPGSLDKATFEQIGPGSDIVIGVKKSGVDHPGVDRRINQQFLSFVSLESDEKQISSLADYNERMARGAKSGLVFPLFFATSAITFGIGLLMLRSKDPDSDEHVDWELS